MRKRLGAVSAAMIDAAMSESNRVDHEWVGTTQANGAVIILAKPSSVKGWIVVLAKFRKEHVVWNMCEATHEFQSGKYFQTFSAANLKYQEVR